MRNVIHVLFVAAGLTMAAVPALAHYSLFAVFDEDQSVTLKGVISKVEWVNPHVYLYGDRRSPLIPNPKSQVPHPKRQGVDWDLGFDYRVAVLAAASYTIFPPTIVSTGLMSLI
jgi:hypothetical protein